VLKDRYLVGEQLSLGRVAAVYLARDRHDPSRALVIKELSDMMLLGRDERKQAAMAFQRLAHQWSALAHPNLVRLLDFFSHGRNFYLVTEFVPGCSLEDILTDSAQPLTEDLVRSWAVQLCDVLAYLHGQEPPIIFADLKPGHVLVSRDGLVKLVDFNLTRLFEPWRGGVDPTRIGTPGYAAPEQARGVLSPQSDLYALGRVLYAVLTRQPLGGDASAHASITGAGTSGVQRAVPAISKVLPGLSPTFAQVIEQATQPDPKARFASAHEMRAALLAAGDDASDVAAQPVPLLPRLPPYYFADGKVASDLEELTNLALANWDQALRQFYDGTMADWLRQRAEGLRQGMESPLSAKLASLARKAERVREENLQMASDFERQVAFYDWLEGVGHIKAVPVLEVEPTELDLGALASSRRRVIHLRVRNAGGGYLLGRAQSRVPWVETEAELFGCGPGQSVEVVVRVRGSLLPPGVRGSPQALLIDSNGGRTWIGLRVTLAGPPALAEVKPVPKARPRPGPAPAPILEVAETALDFGPVAGDAPVVRELVIRNRGDGRLTGRVESRLPWLTVAQAAFVCPSQEDVRVAVRLDPARLEPGAHAKPQAIVVDSDFGQAAVEVRVMRVKPVLDLNPQALAFGAHPVGEEPQLRLVVTNRGTGALRATLQPQVPWLAVTPDEVSCEAGKSVACRLVAHTGALPAGLTRVANALQVTSNGGQISLPAEVEVLIPRLQVETPRLDFGLVALDASPQRPLVLRNVGTASLHARLVSEAPSLQVNPSEVSIEPGQRAWVQARLIGLAEDWTDQPAVRVCWAGGEELVRASARLALPRLVVIPERVLDFGYVEPASVAEKAITISNPGGEVLNWQVEVGDVWLEVTPSSGACRPGESVQLTARAYTLALPAESSEGQTWLQVSSNAGQTRLPVHLEVATPRLALEILELTFGASVNYEPVSQTVRVFNQGLGRLQGRIRSLVGWLRPEPQEFECETGASCAIVVTALPAGLPPGRTVKAAALRIESNGGDRDLDARIELVLEPRLEVSPSALEFSGQPGVTSEPLLLINTGYAPLEARLSPGHPALSLSRTTCVVKPQKSVEVEVVLDAGRLREGPADRLGVEVEAAEEITWVPVKMRPAAGRQS